MSNPADYDDDPLVSDSYLRYNECAPSGCQCDCHKPGMNVSHIVACCDGFPPELLPIDPETGRYHCCGTDALRIDAFHAAGCPNILT